MSFSLYRRHSTACTGKYHKKPSPQDFTRCSCPIYCYGVEGDAEVRRSMKTRDWGRAEAQLAAPAAPEPEPRITVTAAVAAFLQDCGDRHLDPRTLIDYRSVFKHFMRFYGEAGTDQITVESLGTFRSGLRNKQKKPLTAKGSLKVLKILRVFCAFCLDRGWIAANHAKKLKPPKDDGIETQPFTPEQVKAILAAATDPLDRGLILTMLYSGMRIGDASTLKRDRVDFERGMLILRQEKTRRNTYIALHPALSAALQALPVEGDYFFWRTESKSLSCTWYCRVRLMRVFEQAGVVGHPHMFRDTCAVEMLNNGEDIRTVQLVLGHSSVQTTERHYAPWVKSFQRRLDDAVQKLSF